MHLVQLLPFLRLVVQFQPKAQSRYLEFLVDAKILKRDYIERGLTTPEQIMRKYTPSSNGSWASSVNQWMAEMRYNDRVLGRVLKEDASVLEFATPSASTTSSASAVESAEKL